MFSIGFTDESVEYPYDDTSIPAAPGSLVLGKATEEFLANLSVWGRSDYESHWAHELQALLDRNPKVALVVSYYVGWPILAGLVYARVGLFFASLLFSLAVSVPFERYFIAKYSS